MLNTIGLDEAAILPYVLELLSVKDSGIDKIDMSPEARKDRIKSAIRQITLKGSEIRPLVIAVEDLHWIDRSSEEYLKTLLESISGGKDIFNFHLPTRICAHLGRQILSQPDQLEPTIQPGKPGPGCPSSWLRRS
jgi:predicted ATPase